MSQQSPESNVVVFTSDEKLIEALTNSSAPAGENQPSLVFASTVAEISNHLDADLCVYDLDIADGDERQASVDILQIKNSATSLNIILLGHRGQLKAALDAPRTKPHIARSVTKPVTASQFFMAINSVRLNDSIQLDSETRAKRKGVPLGLGLAGAGLFIAAVLAVFFLSADDDNTDANKYNSVVTHEQAEQVDAALSAEQTEDKQEIDRLLDLAQTALDSGNVVLPENANALSYFEQILEIDVYHEHAYVQKQTIISELRASFPKKLADENYAEAQVMLTVLNQAEPFSSENRRMAQALADARATRSEQNDAKAEAQDTRSSDVADAVVVQDQAEQSEQAKAQQRAQEFAQAQAKTLKSIDSALASGKLVPPKAGNAYLLLLQAVQQGDIDSDALDSRRGELAGKLNKRARAAIAANDFNATNSALTYIQNLGDPNSTVASLRNEMQQARRRLAEQAAQQAKPVAAKPDSVAKNPTKPKRPQNTQAISTDKPYAIIPPEIIKRVEPDYPRRAYNLDIQGWVKLEYRVDEKGRAVDIRVVEAQPKKVFEKAGVRALERWRFAPATHSVSGKPLVSEVTTTRFNFSLAN